MTTFSELELDPRVLQAVADAGYETPTPIQAQAIPHALEGRDVLGIAQTGTGKTASFVLPMLTMLAKGRARARMPRTLVLCPTRELAAQVAENFETYARHIKLTMALLIGGVSFKDQDKLIDRGVDVLIATPGRLLDHFERGKLMLTGVQIMVVDEADRMLDMGFIPDIERIFKLTPFTRQTLFFSATMPPEITRITQEFLHNPVRVEVARQATASEMIEQALVMHTPSRRDRTDSDKREVLRRLIRAQGEGLTNGIIFCNRKRDVDILAKSLQKHGFDAKPIHGDLDQSVRTQILGEFRAGGLSLLVASDVAARGLDISNVSHVFNFDVPIHCEDYVHRIGRTGRAGRSGKSFTIAVPADQKYIDRIEEMVGNSIPRLDSPLQGGGAEADEGGDRGRRREGSGEESKGRSRRRGGRGKAAAEASPPADRQAEDRPAGDRSSGDRSSGDRTAKDRPARDRQTSESGDEGLGRRGEGRPRGSEDRGRDRGAGSGRRGGGQIVGLGSHVPAFLLRDLATGAPVDEAEDADSDDNEAEEATVEAPEAEASAAPAAAAEAPEAEAAPAADVAAEAPEAEAASEQPDAEALPEGEAAAEGKKPKAKAKPKPRTRRRAPAAKPKDEASSAA